MSKYQNYIWGIIFFTYLTSSCVNGIVAAEENDIQEPQNVTEPIAKDEIKLNIDISQSNVKKKSEVLGEKADESILQGTENQHILVDVTTQNSGALNDITSTGTPVIILLPDTVTVDINLNTKVENVSSTIPETVQENRTEETAEWSRDEMANTTNKTVSEDIPSFSEWAQKRLEEAEVSNDSVQHNANSNGKIGLGVRLGWKNYASPDCGAKVVAANPEAENPSSVISQSREEYKLNLCTNKIWFIVELCESIQAKKIEIANFELFSSTPKDFVVSVSDRFPNRDWTIVGQFSAKDERTVQSFDLNPFLFGRYIKVEVKSHYGYQHYCPISLFRVYGISELEVLQKEELSHAGDVDEDDVEDDEDVKKHDSELVGKNMLNSATNAVYSMIKKVLGTKSNETEKNSQNNSDCSPLMNSCSTPSHNIVCVNCTHLLFGQIFELLSCKSSQLNQLLEITLIKESLANSDACVRFGSERRHAAKSITPGFAEFYFPQQVIGAMCNILNVFEKRAVLNVGSQYFVNTTTDINSSEIGETTNSENVKIASEITSKTNEKLETVRLESSDGIKARCSTDTDTNSPIFPTKTVTVSEENSSVRLVEEVKDVEPTKDDSSAVDVTENSDATEQPNNLYLEVENATVEASENNIDQMENFMSDMNGDYAASAMPSTASSVANAGDRQKESVFLRLSNRIKALERNVSLSSQYLEELSRRYKKQVEEMQKLMQTLTEERKTLEDRNRQLEEKLDYLFITVVRWPNFIFWLVLTLVTTSVIFWICRLDRRKNNLTREIVQSEQKKWVDMEKQEKKSKRRRPSDQALKIVRSSLLTDERKYSREKRKRRKSNKGIKRSSSLTTLNVQTEPVVQLHKLPSDMLTKNVDWVEENSKHIEVVSLDDSEHLPVELFSHTSHMTKTASDTRAQRISSQRNASVDATSFKNSLYESPTKSKFKLMRSGSLNGGNIEGNGGKKERKSFKSVLKNVFS